MSAAEVKELRAELDAYKSLVAQGLRIYGPDCAYIAPEVLQPRREGWIAAAKVALGAPR